MRIALKRRFFLTFLLLLVTSGAASLYGAADKSVKKPVLNGTFIQLLDENGNWSRARWEQLFNSFHAIGLTQVVIQWSLLDDSAFYASPATGETPKPIEIILQLAQARGIEVYLGLAAESRYWEMIKLPPAGQKEYLKQLRWKSEQVARQLAGTASSYEAFKGWYIPEEIDDLTWRAPASRQLLFQHLKELSAFLKQLTPGEQVLLSAFSSARMDPDTYQQFWSDLLRQSSVDILLFQDAAGTGKLPRELLPIYLKALRSATDVNSKKLQVVVELFEMVSETPFKALPAPIKRVKQQLQVAGDYASGGINAFSVPDYLLLEGSAPAKELLDGYLKYREGHP